MENQAMLRSNDGESEFTIQFDSPAKYATQEGFESSIEISGQHFDGDHSFPFSTTIKGLWLNADDIAKLRDCISRWADQPMDQLNAKDLAGEFELAKLPGQSLRIKLGPRKESGSSLHPTVSVAFSTGAFRGDVYFLTDQSCLASFAREIGRL